MLAFVLIALLALAQAWPPFGQPAATLFNEAAANLDKAPVVDLTSASWVQAGMNFSGEIVADRRGQARFDLHTPGGPVTGLMVGGKVYVKAARLFWTAVDRTALDPSLARVLADRWVLDRDTSLSQALDAAARPHAFNSLATPDLRKGATGAVDGHRVVELSSRGGSAWVTTDEPTRFVRIASAAVSTDSGVSQLHGILRYPPALTVTAPAPVLDPLDPTTFPARYVYVSGDSSLPPCDPNNCKAGAVVRNVGGRPDGQASLTLSFKSSDGASALGSCSANIPAIAHDQTEAVGCAVQSPALQAYFRAGHASFAFETAIHNPAWDG